MLSISTLCLVSIPVFAIYIRLCGAKPLPGIPYSKFHWWLPLGSLFDLAIHFVCTGEVFDWFSLQCLRHKSPVAQLFLPNFSYTEPVVIVADLREIEDITTRRMDDIDRSSLMQGFFSLFAFGATIGMKTRNHDDTIPNHHSFRQQRRLWNCMMTPRMLEQVVTPAIYRAVERMVDLWELKMQAAPGYAFLIDPDLREATLEGMWEMLTGASLGVLDSVGQHIQDSGPKNVSLDTKQRKAVFKTPKAYPPLYHALNTLFVAIDWYVTGFSQHFYAWVFKCTGILRNAMRLRNETLDRIICNARACISADPDSMELSTNSVLKEVLIRDAELASKTSPPISNAALRDEMMELLVTGHETTASSIGWALKHLADNQDSQQQLWHSLMTAFPDVSQSGFPSAEELMKADLPYLDAVIAETLRISCTGPVSFREAIRDCQILGHDIKAGTHIVLVTGGPSYVVDSDRRFVVEENVRSPTSQKAALRRGSCENRWDDSGPAPTLFEPSRWITADNKFNQYAFPSLPFSAGPRGCFGKKIALAEMRLMLAMVLLKFHLPKLSPNLSKYSSRDSLTRKPTGCYVRPERRAATY